MNQTIVRLRCIAILLIVIHHSMCAFEGWPPNHTIDIPVPSIFSSLSIVLKAFGLGAFSFISGYVLYYQSKKNESWTIFLRKKVKRILLPCIIWSIFYSLLYPSFMLEIWPSGINGSHLWYLPVLFVCILLISIDLYCTQLTKSIAWMIIAWMLLFMLCRVTTFRTIHECVNYLPVVFVGYLCNRLDINKLIDRYKCSILTMGGVICVIVTFCNIHLFSWLIKMSAYSVFLYSFIYLYTKNHEVKTIENGISKCSFCIYLIHQFVINFLLLWVPFSRYGYFTSVLVISTISVLIPWLLDKYYTKIILIQWKKFIS